MAVMRALGNYLVAWICDLVTGASGGMINVDGWREELYRTEMEVAEVRRRADRLEEKVNPAPRPFEAYTDCPKCGHMDHHWLRASLPKPVGGPVCVLPDGAEIHRWDGMSGPDESRFEVIRICTDCGHEWGML